MKVNLRNDNNKDKIINSTENAVKSTSLNVFDLMIKQIKNVKVYRKFL